MYTSLKYTSVSLFTQLGCVSAGASSLFYAIFYSFQVLLEIFCRSRLDLNRLIIVTLCYNNTYLLCIEFLFREVCMSELLTRQSGASDAKHNDPNHFPRLEFSEIRTKLAEVAHAFQKLALPFLELLRKLGSQEVEVDELDVEYSLPNGGTVFLSEVAEYHPLEADGRAVHLTLLQLQSEGFPMRDFRNHPNLTDVDRLAILREILVEHAVTPFPDQNIALYIAHCFGADCAHALRQEGSLRFPGDSHLSRT